MPQEIAVRPRVPPVAVVLSLEEAAGRQETSPGPPSQLQHVAPIRPMPLTSRAGASGRAFSRCLPRWTLSPPISLR